ncbi:XRE family transcriptional regulator [uncultured Erythrobacter sp.]|uniref:helix-turn-helix domain-containing protein n=1 Tax=uncultured Erythrobacter sp. TaxID=263913 RepID=UPI00262CD39F|nr:XRE family transcriptional regulator [uncultured Erythrobacter sp.]
MQEIGTNVASSGFNPLRLSIARSARGLKKVELAAKIGRSPAIITKWESAEYSHKPDEEDLARLSQSLRVDPTWFFKGLVSDGSASFFRSLRSELKSARDKTAAKLVFAHDIYEAAAQHIEFPYVDIPQIEESNSYKTLSMDRIDSIADQVRDYWGLGDGPIDDVLTVIENAGVIVADDYLVSKKLDGVSRWFDDRPVILLAKDKETGVRRRFDAAHELGHIILHRNVSDRQLIEDWQLIEDQAMAFAAAFLMPSSSFAHSVRDTSLDSLANLKPIWKVSIAAMLMRLRSLNLIDQTESKNLWKYYSYRKWRGNEPHDNQIDFEEPVNLASAIAMIAEDGLAELRKFLRDVGLLPDDLSSLAGVSEGTFALATRPKPRLKLVRNLDSVKSAAND